MSCTPVDTDTAEFEAGTRARQADQCGLKCRAGAGALRLKSSLTDHLTVHK